MPDTAMLACRINSFRFMLRIRSYVYFVIGEPLVLAFSIFFLNTSIPLPIHYTPLKTPLTSNNSSRYSLLSD